MNRIILLNVEDAWIKRGGETAGASGSANAVTLRMRFDQCWDGTSKTAYFTDALGENSVKVLLGLDLLTEDGAYDVPVPGEAMAYPGQATVTVTGQSHGRIITTQAARFKVLDAMVPDSAGNSQPVTPDEASQLQAQIDALENLFVTNRQQAQTAAQDAEDAKEAVLDALDNLPTGAVVVINDLTTGGKAAALSAEQGKKLEETKANRQLSNLDTTQAALAALGAGVRPSALDNAIFVGGGGQNSLPINQVAGQPDRWKPFSGTSVAINSNSVTFSNSTGQGDGYYPQIVPFSKVNLGKKYTASALFLSGLPSKYVEVVCYNSGSPGYQLFDGDTVNDAGISSVTFTVPIDTTSVEFRFIVGPYSAVGSIEMVGGKLEEGEGQTLAYQDSDGNWHLLPQPGYDYATQLLICQQYQLKLAQYYIAPAINIEQNYIDFSIPIPIAMRTVPVLGADSSFSIVAKSVQQTGFSLTVPAISSNAIRLRAVKQNHGLVFADNIRFEVTGDTTILNANL